MSLEAADWVIVGQQVKHHGDYMILISSIRFTSEFVIKTLVGLRWMQNDVHRAFKWGSRVALSLSQFVHNVDNKPDLITMVLSYYRLCMLFRSCILVSTMCLFSCPLLICIHENSCPWGQLPAIEQCLHRLVSDQ